MAFASEERHQTGKVVVDCNRHRTSLAGQVHRLMAMHFCSSHEARCTSSCACCGDIAAVVVFETVPGYRISRRVSSGLTVYRSPGSKFGRCQLACMDAY